MGYNRTNVSRVLKNTGLQKFPGTIGKLKYMIQVPKGTSILTHVLALTKGTWVDSLNAAIGTRWFIMPMIFNGTPTQGEPKWEESDFGHRSFVDNGKLDYMIDFEEIHIYNKNGLFSMNSGDFDAYFITDKDFIRGYSSDGVTFKPYEMDYTRVLPETQNTGSANARVQLSFRAKDVRQWNDFDVALDCVNDSLAPAAWYPSLELPAAAITDLDIELLTLTATAFTFRIAAIDGTPYSACVKEDIYLRKTTLAGTLIPITSITESSTKGTWAGVIGTQTSGTFYLSLLDQDAATTQGVETPDSSSLAVTI